MSFTKKQLLPGENLVVLTRQHPLTLFWPVVLNIVALAVLIFVSYYYRNAWIMLLYIIPLVYFLWQWMAWRRKEYILTDRRVVIQQGVLSVSSLDASLDKINNVFHQQSFMGRLLNYGEVGLETASEQGTTIFSFLTHPLDFKNAIVRQRELYNAARNRPQSPPHISVPQLIEELASLRDRQIITEAEFQEKKRALLEKM